MKTIYVSILLLGLLPGCMKSPVKKPVVVIPPTAPPVLPKTYGELQINEGNGLALRYKSIQLVIGPSGRAYPQLDYVLLPSRPEGEEVSRLKNIFSSDQKFVVSPNGKSDLQRAGFTEVKALEPGQKILLKKEGGFIFVTALAGKNSAGKMVDGYFLEFDNGRLVLDLDGVVEESSLREFLYNLRDDGKEVDLLLIEADAEAKLASRLSLFQPKIALILPSSNSLNEATLKTALAEELFSGSYRLLHSGDTVPF